MNLADLQRFFANAATSGSGPRAGLEGVFVSDARLSASARLGIYNRAYYYRQLDALASVFEQVQRCVGRAEFERVGLAYLTLHPSEHPALERVGRSFPMFLRTLERSRALVDLAELEWARLCALVAPNPTCVATPADIDPASFPGSRLQLVPSLRCLELASGTLSVFVDGILAEDSEPAERTFVAVWRSQHAVSHQELGALEGRALHLAAHGASLGEICELFASDGEPEDAQRAFLMLRAWFAREWVESLALSRP